MVIWTYLGEMVTLMNTPQNKAAVFQQYMTFRKQFDKLDHSNPGQVTTFVNELIQYPTPDYRINDLIGRCFLLLNDKEKATQYFEESKKQIPHRLELSDADLKNIPKDWGIDELIKRAAEAKKAED